MEAAATKKNVYPHFVVENNTTPNRLYAFPLLGFIVKIILLLPVTIEMLVLSLYAFVLFMVNCLVILFTGKYWDYAYNLFIGLMRLEGKMQLFLFGLTDKYPGFGLDTNGLFTLEIAKPEKPNRWFAFPFLGLLARMILMIPYFIYSTVLSRGSGIAMFFSWFIVLFKGKFPESLYEFERDTLRVAFASSSYLLGFSDEYPSFYISMHHQTVKILLIVAGALLVGASFFNQPDHERRSYQSEHMDTQYQMRP